MLKLINKIKWFFIKRFFETWKSLPCKRCAQIKHPDDGKRSLRLCGPCMDILNTLIWTTNHYEEISDPLLREELIQSESKRIERLFYKGLRK